MRLVTYRKGSANPRVGALTADAVLDLGALAVDLARERGLARPAPGGRFGTMLELIAGGDDARSRAREALEHGLAVWKREGVDGLAAKKLGAPAAKIRLEAPIPRPPRNFLPRAELYGARRRARRRGARPSRVLQEGAGVRAGPRREDRPPSGDAGAGLRGRAGGRHWRGRPRHPARGGPRPRLRLHDRQRRDGARPPETPRSVVQGQVARRPRQPGHRALISQPSTSSTVTVRSAKATGATRCPRSNVTAMSILEAGCEACQRRNCDTLRSISKEGS